LEWGAWNYEFTGFPIPDGLHNAIYKKHETFLLSLKTKEEALLATWCLTNQVPLTNARNNKDWITVAYEQLLQDPEKEIKRIFSRWDLPVPDKTIEGLRKPSSTTKNDTFTKSTEQQLSKWQTYFNTSQLSQFKEILDYFEVDIYTATDIYPTNNFLD
jgi:hypothetical protein